MNWLLLSFLRQRRKVLLSSFLVLNMSDCLAALEDFSEQSITLDVPVVLSASRLKQTQPDAPNAVTVIDRAMIKASGFRTTADLFKLVPGMYVDYQGGYTPIVGYRGATDAFSRRMQVLIDGRSVYLQPYNAVDWEDLPLHIDDIERIEVVRGPAATSYGSNSILGVINIITRDASALNGGSISATRGNAGNAGISDAVAHFGKSGEQLDYRFTFGKRSDNGFNFPASYVQVFDGYNDSSATHFASLRSNYRFSRTDSLDFQLGFSTGVRATGDPREALYPPRSIETSSGYQQLTWVRALDRGDDIQVHYYHISRNSTDERFSLPVSGVKYWLADNYKTHRNELELQHTLKTNDNNRIVWGMAARYDSVNSPFMFQAPQSVRQQRLFAHDEWRISPQLLLNAGAMLEDDGMGHKNTSPRAALNYHVAPEHTLRTSVSVAYRNPVPFEERVNLGYILGSNLSQYFLSSGGVRPERALSREIGYIGNLGNGLSIDARAYNDQVSDVIWVDAILMNVPGLTSLHDPTWDFRNEFAVRYTGLEGTVKYNWDKNNLTFNFAHQMANAALHGNPKTPSFLPMFLGFARDYSKTIPLNSGSLLFTRQMSDGISFSTGYYQQGALMVLDGTAPQPLTRRVDMRIAKQFGPTNNNKIGGREVSLVVQNAFQNKIVGYSGYSFDRRAYLTATINF